MWSSISRTVAYGWNFGFAIIQKMSDKFFQDDDEFFASVKMPDEVIDLEASKVHDAVIDSSAKFNVDKGEEVSDVTIQLDTFDEIRPNRTTSANVILKKPHKNKENAPKLGFSKSDVRSRLKNSSDVRPSNVGGTSDPRWYNSEKVDATLSDSFNSNKWPANNENTVKSESSLKNHTFHLNASESDIFSSRGGISNHSNESSTWKSHPLFKSSSSSQIPSSKGNFNQSSSRQLKFVGSNNGKLSSVVSVPQSYIPHPVINYPYGRNNCSLGHWYKKTNNMESSLSLADDAETPEGLSWRRLHMSRAKLKATATTSELLSGFAMVAMVELQINSPTDVPEWLFVLFAVCTTVLVSVHIFALMISTYLLPNIDAVSKLHVSSLVTESPHDRMKSFIELAWAFSTILGLFLFLVEIAILCWVKFWDYSFKAAISATMIVIPVLILFVAFAIHFYHSLVVIKCKSSVSNMQELENIKRHLDNVSPA